MDELIEYLKAKKFTQGKTKGKGLTFDFLRNLIEKGKIAEKEVFEYGPRIVENARLILMKEMFPYTVVIREGYCIIRPKMTNAEKGRDSNKRGTYFK